MPLLEHKSITIYWQVKYNCIGGIVLNHDRAVGFSAWWASHHIDRRALINLLTDRGLPFFDWWRYHETYTNNHNRNTKAPRLASNARKYSEDKCRAIRRVIAI
jgi:hypothetical protein